MKTRTATSSSAPQVVIVALAVADREMRVFLNDGLPSSAKRANESLEQCARRQLEEAGVRGAEIVLQLGAYEADSSIVIGFVAVARDAQPLERFLPVGGTSRNRPKLDPIEDVLVRDAVDRVRRDLETTSLATAFVDASFSLSQLRAVYEAIWGVKLDGANFRRTLTGDEGWVVSTGKRSIPGNEGGKPAELYRAGRGWKLGGPVRRPRRVRPASRSLPSRGRAPHGAV